MGSSEPRWLWPDDSDHVFNVWSWEVLQAIERPALLLKHHGLPTSSDHGKQLVTDIWRLESHLQSLGCRASWRHSLDHLSSKFVKIRLNANFNFDILIYFWVQLLHRQNLCREAPSGCACHGAVLATYLEVYSARQRLICQKDQLVEFCPRNTALFQCQLVFFVKVGYSDWSHRSGSRLFGPTGAMMTPNCPAWSWRNWVIFVFLEGSPASCQFGSFSESHWKCQ